MTTTYEYTESDLTVAIQRIGRTCQEQNIDLADLRRAFPDRPSSKSDIDAIVEWQAKYIKAVKATETSFRSTGQVKSINPPRPSSQAKADWSDIATRKDKSEKPMPSYYAVQMDGVLKFYRVKRGRKPGYFFVDVQASDELYPVRSYASVVNILNEISKDPKAAMERYGQEIGSCGHCHRTLTDETSRAFGIGPKCRADGY